MNNINNLIGFQTSLSLVITESDRRVSNKVRAYLLPSHLIGNAITRATMHPGRFIPTDCKEWYPIVDGDNAVDALNKLDEKITAVIGKHWLREDRFVAIVWNTAVALVEQKRNVWNLNDILGLEDVSVLTGDQPPQPPGVVS